MADSPRPTRRNFLHAWLRLGNAGGHSPPNDPASSVGGAAVRSTPPPPAAPARIGRRSVLPIHRPPGAVNEAAFLAGCTRCNDCIKACPVSAIVVAPPKFRHAAGTPMIDPYSSACVMCADPPCIKSCKPGVLRAERPLKMGVAYIERAACLAHAGSFCTVCSERCPVPGAIELTHGKPTIHPETCTGCGVCAAVCPAPSNAVIVMPLADRPP